MLCSRSSFFLQFNPRYFSSCYQILLHFQLYPNELYYLLNEEDSLHNLLSAAFSAAQDIGKLPPSQRETHYKLLYKQGNYTQAELIAGTLTDTPRDPTNNPTNLGNWRPIGLLCCDYKILSAYMASQMQEVMDSVVNIAQSAFIKGRSIHDAIMLVQQLVQQHSADSVAGGLLFLDFAHAYDFISQEYILAVLTAMNFPESFITTLKLQMTAQTSRVMVNGDLTDAFEVNNGGKQGDPLFPLIYVAAVEGLYALLEDSEDYTGILPPGATEPVTHTAYADDAVICIGSIEDRDALTQLLAVFENASGNEVKAHKSRLMWLGPWKNKDWAIEVESGHITHLPPNASLRYLGVRVGLKVSMAEHWDPILQKVTNNPICNLSKSCTVLGRALLQNACLSSQIWFVATQIPMSAAYKQKFRVAFNKYFSKGKRVNSVSIPKRQLPKEMGGLSIIDVDKQLTLLQAKWVSKAQAGSDHPWLVYWTHAARTIAQKKGVYTDLAVSDKPWPKTLPRTLASSLSPITMQAYKAWRSLELPCDQSNIYQLAALPLYNNLGLSTMRAVLPPVPIRPNPPAKKVLEHIHQQIIDRGSTALVLGDLFTETTPPLQHHTPSMFRLPTGTLC